MSVCLLCGGMTLTNRHTSRAHNGKRLKGLLHEQKMSIHKNKTNIIYIHNTQGAKENTFMLDLKGADSILVTIFVSFLVRH